LRGPSPAGAVDPRADRWVAAEGTMGRPRRTGARRRGRIHEPGALPALLAVRLSLLAGSRDRLSVGDDDPAPDGGRVGRPHLPHPRGRRPHAFPLLARVPARGARPAAPLRVGAAGDRGRGPAAPPQGAVPEPGLLRPPRRLLFPDLGGPRPLP